LELIDRSERIGQHAQRNAEERPREQAV
jgi:hypothetical protein